jgi:glycosyltransferase involved in cell wall biosynthesis
MGSEKIVIATNIGGSTETIVNQKSGYLIPPDNPKILAKYIIDVKNKKITLNSCDILKRVNKFSLEKIEKNIISFYKIL